MFGDVKGQEQERQYEELTDQFGRLYSTQVEKKTGDPCQALRPIDWAAPIGPDWFRNMLLPPEDLDITTMVPRGRRARLGYAIFINHERWLEKWDARDEDYQKKLTDIARGMTKSQNVVELLKNPPPELLKFVGRGPMPPREFIEASAAGNAWAIGRSEHIPRKARALLDLLAPMFAQAKSIRRKAAGIIDPFAEDDDDDEETTVATGPMARRFDPLADDQDDDLVIGDQGSEQIEEVFDPQGMGGKREPVGTARGRGARRTPRAEPAGKED